MRRLLVTVLAISTLAACGSDTPTIPLNPTDANVTGVFDLSTANGQPPPYAAFQTNTELWELTNDRMVIAADNTFADTTTYTVVEIADGTQSTQRTSTAGTYQVANDKINFTTTTNGSAVFSGSVTGNTLVLLFNGGRFVYSK
jgi:hypothetical protein